MFKLTYHTSFCIFCCLGWSRCRIGWISWINTQCDEAR